MIRWPEALALLLVFVPAGAGAVVFTGEVQVNGAQGIYTPPSLSSPVVLRYYVGDGNRVRKGDELLRIDAGPAESQLRTLQAQIEQTEAKTAKEIAELELKQVDADLALADAQAERDTAAVDAAIPRALISALNYDRYQGEMRRTEQALALKKTEASQAAAAVTRRSEDGALELRKQQLSLGFYQGQVARAVVRAEHDGTAVHGFDNLFGAGSRYEEGSSSYPGTEVGEVVGTGNGYAVRGWVLEPDSAGLHVGMPLRLHFDALPGHDAIGRIRTIAGAPSSKSAWGDGRYVEVGVSLPADLHMALLQGMSVRLDSDLDDPGDRESTGLPDPGKLLQVDGEIYAQRSLAISPPAVDGLWQMTVTQMAGDGAKVKKGDPVVVFEGTTVMKDLTTKQGQLDEKRRRQEQLRLDLADRAREAELATAQAKADLDKAMRKANQPKEYVARVDYSKLVIARSKAERRYALTAQRAHVAATERTAEQRMADAEVTQLDAEVAKLKAALASLTVPAPRDGIVLHQSSFDGGRVDVGSQIWMGQSVAQMPDLSTLAVRAALPERDLDRAQIGQRVRVVLSGGGERGLDGRIAEIGNTVHSRSRVDAVPVVDLVVTLDQGLAGLKPGQTVQVDIPAQGATTQ
ncbi:HlyD family efflux transporter periplasmic adaptor subunit [Rhodanobacter sp. 7MK24]|uniref:HlyD family secretion protein n=1 Tax=Rhodanobacter sp. 7MK24 TaxID=2775922 RepID=UPI00177C172B|nr:HlyD family efflux transporter periplasmic adaptor subunit [Rhodanobacter sp. 7MK24]MBD8879932.1 HlyD family efflux transporter periplasmic adaptor subunit [Rhodanobacter sp. 7MK24]